MPKNTGVFLIVLALVVLVVAATVGMLRFIHADKKPALFSRFEGDVDITAQSCGEAPFSFGGVVFQKGGFLKIRTDRVREEMDIMIGGPVSASNARTLARDGTVKIPYESWTAMQNAPITSEQARFALLGGLSAHPDSIRPCLTIDVQDVQTTNVASSYILQPKDKGGYDVVVHDTFAHFNPSGSSGARGGFSVFSGTTDGATDFFAFFGTFVDTAFERF